MNKIFKLARNYNIYFGAHIYVSHVWEAFSRTKAQLEKNALEYSLSVYKAKHQESSLPLLSCMYCSPSPGVWSQRERTNENPLQPKRPEMLCIWCGPDGVAFAAHSLTDGIYLRDLKRSTWKIKQTNSEDEKSHACNDRRKQVCSRQLRCRDKLDVTMELAYLVVKCVT